MLCTDNSLAGSHDELTSQMLGTCVHNNKNEADVKALKAPVGGSWLHAKVSSSALLKRSVAYRFAQTSIPAAFPLQTFHGPYTLQ